MDIFRFEQDRIVEHWDAIQPVAVEIVEHWDAIQPVAVDSVSGNTMFDGGGMYLETVDNEAADEQEAANIAVVSEFYAEAFNNGNLAVLDHLVAQDFVEHNPDIADGRDGLAAALMGLLEATQQLHIEPKRFVAEGELVFAHVHLTFTPEALGDETMGLAGVDVFRLEDGVLVEHWEATQPVPAETVSGNSVF